MATRHDAHGRINLARAQTDYQIQGVVMRDGKDAARPVYPRCQQHIIVRRIAEQIELLGILRQMPVDIFLLCVNQYIRSSRDMQFVCNVAAYTPHPTNDVVVSQGTNTLLHLFSPP